MQQVQAVVQHADDQNAQNHAAGGTHAAGHAGAAQNRGGHRVRFVAHAHGGLTGGHAAGQHNTGKGRQQAAERVNKDLYLVNVNTRKPRGLPVAANGVNLAAYLGLG